MLALVGKICFLAGMRDEPKSTIDRVKQDFGGCAGLARKLNELNPTREITGQAISQWKQVPHERVIDVETATGIPRDELRPDLAKIFAGAA